MAKVECGAKTRAGNQCKQPAMRNGRCRYHGGKTPAGFALPQTKHGRYSKYLPARMRDDYEAAEADDDLLSRRAQAAFYRARMLDLLRRVDDGDAGATWRSLRDAMRELQAARARKDVDGMEASLDEIARLVERGAGDANLWDEIYRVGQLELRAAESERRRLVDMRQMISAERAQTMIGYLLDSVLRHVRDDGALRAISADVSRLLGDDRRRVDDA